MGGLARRKSKRRAELLGSVRVAASAEFLAHSRFRAFGKAGAWKARLHAVEARFPLRAIDLVPLVRFQRLSRAVRCGMPVAERPLARRAMEAAASSEVDHVSLVHHRGDRRFALLRNRRAR
jgi:hypothetical protein